MTTVGRVHLSHFLLVIIEISLVVGVVQLEMVDRPTASSVLDACLVGQLPSSPVEKEDVAIFVFGVLAAGSNNTLSKYRYSLFDAWRA